MQLTAYLNFNGNCETAFGFYAQTFARKITFLMKFGDSPMAGQVPPEMKDKIMHATLEVPGGGSLMGADHPHGSKVQPTGFCVSIQVDDPAKGEKIFNALSDQGHVQMPFQKTFWSPGFGMCTDRFDIPWMVNCTAAA